MTFVCHRKNLPRWMINFTNGAVGGGDTRYCSMASQRAIAKTFERKKPSDDQPVVGRIVTPEALTHRSVIASEDCASLRRPWRSWP
jgi:hypothetical protein